MNPNDYDDDGNNIVPCPICLSQYCPSKDGGKCQDEEDFIKSTTNMNNKQWKEEFYQKFGHIQVIKDDKNGNSYDRITDFISALLKEREAEIRKETIKEVLPCKVKTTIGKESKYFKEYGFDRNNFATGHNQCRQSIIDKAKSKFNITI